MQWYIVYDWYQKKKTMMRQVTFISQVLYRNKMQVHALRTIQKMNAYMYMYVQQHLFKNIVQLQDMSCRSHHRDLLPVNKKIDYPHIYTRYIYIYMWIVDLFIHREQVPVKSQDTRFDFDLINSGYSLIWSWKRFAKMRMHT